MSPLYSRQRSPLATTTIAFFLSLLCSGAAKGGLNVTIRDGDGSTISPGGPLAINNIDELLGSEALRELAPYRLKFLGRAEIEFRIGNGEIERVNEQVKIRLRSDGVFVLRARSVQMRGRWDRLGDRVLLIVRSLSVRPSTSATLLALDSLMPAQRVRQYPHQFFFMVFKPGTLRFHLDGTLAPEFVPDRRPLSVPDLRIRFPPH